MEITIVINDVEFYNEWRQT